MRRAAVPILCAIFFLSGAGALVLQTLWFRQAGLAFGNSVWASTLVLSSFMAGLALGNLAVVRFGDALERPVRFYAGLEVTVGLVGALLVYTLPGLGLLLAPWLGDLRGEPFVLNVVRFAVGFPLLVLPATAMGATLPVLVKALSAWERDFGAVLGLLYGFNTLGAVLGALAAETVLLELVGVRGTALVASGLYLGSAAVALAIDASQARSAPLPEPRAVGDLPSAARSRAFALAASSFLAGFALLAFEIVWFRFVRLFIDPNPTAFAVMLAVVLSGIGLGGTIAGLVLRRFPRADAHAPALACLAGALAVILYARFPAVLAPLEQVYVQQVREVLRLSALLMAPVALLSGMLFTFTGTALHRVVTTDVRATGWLSLANTVGGALGSIAGAFVLLPWLGIEGSFFALAALYAGVAVLLLAARVEGPVLVLRGVQVAAAAVLAWSLLAFPFGSMRETYLPILASRYGYPEASAIVDVREGRSETVMMLRTESPVEPPYHRLVTGSFSMASNQVLDRRYMKLFVYWPIALAPDAESALLISYGIGSTAKALTDTAGLEHIDVVDISREVIETGDVVFPDPAEHPLRDPRVELHIDDGRYFLQTTDRRYDLITSEPPPPKHAGVVNLYTREYFQLMHDRLRPGGINTYWLPVHLVTKEETRAIIRAYCDVFEDCSLWGGFGYSWMLAGAREASWDVDEEAFSRQWRDPVVAPELRTLGVERPEQLGALFMGDAEDLARIVGDGPRVTDDFPKRLQDVVTGPDDFAWYLSLMDPEENARAFAESGFVREAWPAGLRERSLAYFPLQAMIDVRMGFTREAPPLGERLRTLHRLQTGTPLETLALWHLGSLGGGAEGIDPGSAAMRVLSARDFDGAHDLYQQARRLAPEDAELAHLDAYALCMTGALEPVGVPRARCGELDRVMPVGSASERGSARLAAGRSPRSP